MGSNKGEKVPRELAALLEAESWIKEVELDLDTWGHDTDVLILGGEGAGTAAALMASEQGAKVLLVTKLRFGDCNTVMAQGGIQEATLSQDNNL